MSKERLKYYHTHEPLTLCRGHICRDGVCSQADIERIEREVEQRMEEAIEYAKNSPEPSVQAFLAEVERS